MPSALRGTAASQPPLSKVLGAVPTMSKLRGTIEIIGITSIVLSLVFVGMQLRQTQEVAAVTLYQMRSDASREVNTSSAEIYLSAVEQGILEPNAGSAVFVLDRVSHNVFNHFENTHFLYERGFLEPEHWESDLRTMEASLDADNSFLRDYWIRNQNEYRVTFKDIVNQLISEDGT